MMKRILAMLCAMMLLCGCAAAEESLQGRYDAAALLMVGGDHAAAARAFGALYGYMDAPQMAIYCQGLAWREAGRHDLAEEAFGLIPGFKDADIQAVYSRGLAEEAAAAAAGQLRGEVEHLQKAVEHYEPLMSLPWVAERAERCSARLGQIEGKIVDALGEAEDGLCIITRDGLQGVINARGEMVVPCQWVAIHAIADGLALVEDENGCGVIRLTGEVLIPTEATQIDYGYSWRLKKGGSWATVYRAKDVIERWDGTTLYLNSGWQTVRGEEGLGMMDPQGQLVTPCRYDSVDLNEMAGFISAYGDERGAELYRLDGTPVELPEGMWMALSYDGDEAYNTGLLFSEDMEPGVRSCVRSLDGTFSFEAEGMIDVYCMTVWDAEGGIHTVPGLYEALIWNGETDGIMNYTFCMLDATGKELLREEGFRLLMNVEERYLVMIADRSCLRIRDLQTGTFTDIPLGFEWGADHSRCDYVGGGLLYIRNFENDQYMRITLQGVVLPEDARYEDGLITTKQESTGLYGVHDMAGNEVLPPVYKDVRLGDGLIWVESSEGLWGTMDRGGREVLPAIYKDIDSGYGLIWVESSEGLCGLVDRQGREVLPVAYTDIDADDYGLVWGELPDGREELRDRAGNLLVTVEPGDEFRTTQGCIYHLRGGLLTIYTVPGVEGE